MKTTNNSLYQKILPISILSNNRIDISYNLREEEIYNK
jgi:hypothetical protein